MKTKHDVIISNLAWIDKKHLTEVDIFQIKKPLRVTPNVMDADGVQSIDMFRETETHLGVPRNYFRLTFNPQYYNISYDLCQGRRLPFNQFKIELRPEDQEPFVMEMVNVQQLGNWGCGIGEGYTGFGKSVCGIRIAELLNRNTLIIVHNEEIRDVWFTALKKFYPNATVGLIQGDNCDYECDFVIAMCQSLMNDNGKYPRQIYRTFGTVFVDEVHRFGSRSFGSVAIKFNPKYIFGLTGTERRKDDCEEVYRWVIGTVVVMSDEANRIKPTIWFRDTGVQVPFINVPFKNVFGKKQMKKTLESPGSWTRPKLLRFLSTHKYRQQLIASDVVASLKNGRNPLLVAERKQALYDIAKLVEEKTAADPFFTKKVTHGFYFGSDDEMNKNSRPQLDAAARCSVVYATLQKAKEGVDIVRLDTLFLVTPNTDTEQVCGRIARPTLKKENGVMKIQQRVQPVVMDYVDGKIGQCKSSFEQRLMLYMKLGWKIVDVNKIEFGD